MSHRIFDTSIEKNSQLASKLYSYLRESFDVPIFPVLGNHEAHPLDLWVLVIFDCCWYSVKVVVGLLLWVVLTCHGCTE